MRRTVWIIPFLCAFWLLHTHTHKHKHTLTHLFQDPSHLCKEDEEDYSHGPLMILSFLNLDRHLVLSKSCNMVKPRTKTRAYPNIYFFFNGKEAQELRTVPISSLDQWDMSGSPWCASDLQPVNRQLVLLGLSFPPWNVLDGKPASSIPSLLWGLLSSSRSL